MKEQMDRTIAGYDHKFGETLNERQNLINDNESLTSKFSNISRQLWTSDKEVSILQNGYKQSLDEIGKMDVDHTSTIDG